MASTALKAAFIRLRAASPNVLRQLYRLARSFGPVQTSQGLPQELVEGCQVVASRYVMLDRLPKGGRVAELGTHRGGFAREILVRNTPRELHLVDVDFSRCDHLVLGDQRVTQHRGFAHEVIATFPDAYFDWVYVDAEHSYDAVLRDTRAAASKVRPGGFLAFNDFTQIDTSLGRYGVHRAVVDFALEAKWPLHFWAYSSDAIYDVALRRP